MDGSNSIPHMRYGLRWVCAFQFRPNFDNDRNQNRHHQSRGGNRLKCNTHRGCESLSFGRGRWKWQTRKKVFASLSKSPLVILRIIFFEYTSALWLNYTLDEQQKLYQLWSGKCLSGIIIITLNVQLPDKCLTKSGRISGYLNTSLIWIIFITLRLWGLWNIQGELISYLARQKLLF